MKLDIKEKSEIDFRATQRSYKNKHMACTTVKIAFSTFFLSVYCIAFSQNASSTDEVECVEVPSLSSPRSQIPNPALINEHPLVAPSQEYDISDILHNQFQYIFSIFQDNPPRLQDCEAPVNCLIKIIFCEKEVIDTHVLQQYANTLNEILHQTPSVDIAIWQSVLDFINFLNKQNSDNV